MTTLFASMVITIGLNWSFVADKIINEQQQTPTELLKNAEEDKEIIKLLTEMTK